MNSIILVGRLTRDPEVKYIGQNSIPVVKFTLAVDRNSKKDDTYKKVDFINIEAWRDAADTCIKKFSKGCLVSVTGALRIDEYIDKEGNKKYMTKVSTNTVNLLQHNKKVLNSAEIFNNSSEIDLDKVALPF